MYILGDLNCDFLNPASYILQDFRSAFNLTQIIRKPTRVTDNSATLIDVILASNTNMVLNANVMPCSISDHDLVYEQLRLKRVVEGGYQIPVPCLNLAQIPVPRLIFAKIPVTKSNKSLELSVCITALFALTYLISSTILRETFSQAFFIFPSKYLPAICKLAELVR